MKPSSEEQLEFNQQGLTYWFEVDDVDAEYQRLSNESVSFIQIASTMNAQFKISLRS